MAKKTQNNGARILKRATKAAQEVAKEAQKRLPPDMLKQIERNANDVQKSLQQAFRQLNRTVTRNELDALAKRVEMLKDRIAALEKANGKNGSKGSATARASTSGKTASPSRSTRRAASSGKGTTASAASRSARTRTAPSRSNRGARASGNSESAASPVPAETPTSTA
jgi:polyhydroxyalkanoate synthesis regulator phasin